MRKLLIYNESYLIKLDVITFEKFKAT